MVNDRQERETDNLSNQRSIAPEPGRTDEQVRIEDQLVSALKQATQRHSTKLLLSILRELEEEQRHVEGDQRLKTIRKCMRRGREWIAKWSPVLGTTAAIGFGVFAVLGYNIACEGLKEQEFANRIACDAILEAKYANDLAEKAIELAEQSISWSYLAYLGEIADLILTETQMCRDNPVLNTTAACEEVAKWTYFRDVVETYNPDTAASAAATPTTTHTPTSIATPLRPNFSKYSTIVNKAKDSFPSAPVEVAAAFLYVPVVAVALVILLVAWLKRGFR